METILFIDTETTGKYLFDRPPSDPGQPRICQVAAVLCDAEGSEAATFSAAICPDGWTIPPEAAAIHGLSDESCKASGVPILLALQVLDAMASRASMIVAHNLSFDASMIASERSRAGLGTFAPTVDRRCTMEHGTGVCKIPGGRRGFKWPKLEELHRHLFGEAFAGAHGALADTLACKRCFFEMRRRDAAKA